jgi:alkylated DNA repair dioxygenase AlkB
MHQTDLFKNDDAEGLPGLLYQAAIVDPEEQRALIKEIAQLPLKPFEFHGFTGKRRVVSFGWRYDFSAQRLEQIEPIPDFLQPLRAKASQFANLSANALEQVLITEYSPGSAIGWHKDKAVFDKVVGVSLGSTCTMRFRRRPDGSNWRRLNVLLEPGSAYLIAGEARSEWEHSIPPVEELRYSVTFRSVR